MPTDPARSEPPGRARSAARVWEILRKVPFKIVFVLAVALQFIGDEYPFSNFPMYSRLEPATSYLYVTDGGDRLLPMLPTFGVPSNELKKIFKTEERRAHERAKHGGGAGIDNSEEKARAGKLALDYLVSRVRPSRRPPLIANGIRVYNVEVKREEHSISQTRELLAELTPSGAGAAR